MEILEALTNRVKSPVFGYFILGVLAINWKVFFFLFGDDSTVTERFAFFDANTDHQTLLVLPLIIAILGAIIYPWVRYVFSYLAKKPIELRQVLQVRADHSVLIEKQKLEEARNSFLAIKEQELIDRAKRTEELEQVEDSELRESLKAEIEELRSGMSQIKSDKERNTSNKAYKSLSELYRDKARIYEKNGNPEAALKEIQKAIGVEEFSL